MRLFVTFKAESTLGSKVMVFEGLTLNQVQDTMVEYYGDSWNKILSEQDLAKLLPMVYCNKNHWVKFGTECKCKSICGKEKTYPTKYEPSISVTLESITQWFKTAKPTFGLKELSTQCGAHIEEFIEFLTAIGEEVPQSLIDMKQKYYEGSITEEWSKSQKIEVLDALADSVVTGTGVAYFAKMKWDEALSEVNRSNFSKFVNNEPLLNDHGKIMKGSNYTKPNLEDYV